MKAENFVVCAGKMEEQVEGDQEAINHPTGVKWERKTDKYHVLMNGMYSTQIVVEWGIE